MPLDNQNPRIHSGSIKGYRITVYDGEQLVLRRHFRKLSQAERYFSTKTMEVSGQRTWTVQMEHQVRAGQWEQRRINPIRVGPHSDSF